MLCYGCYVIDPGARSGDWKGAVANAACVTLVGRSVPQSMLGVFSES